jgi:2-aminobenzoate-CoA ligase
VSAGEFLPKSVSDTWFEKTGIRIIDGIGATEMIHIFVSASGEDIRPGSPASRCPDTRPACWTRTASHAAGRDGTARRDRADRVAAISTTSASATTCRTAGTSPAISTASTRKGYFWFVARADDMIVSAGYNIAGPEVEWALLAHPSVRECAVVGTADPERGTIVKACVVLAPGLTGDIGLVKELQDFVKQRIAPYKYPRVIEFLEALPKTATGKLQRKALRTS